MKVRLYYRVHGLHSLVKECEVEGKLSEYARAKPKCNPKHRPWTTAVDYKIKEEKLLAVLPKKFLPEEPSKILLTVNDTGQTELLIFRSWAKYFPAYNLTISNK